jgi:hypothetical protein
MCLLPLHSPAATLAHFGGRLEQHLRGMVLAWRQHPKDAAFYVSNAGVVTCLTGAIGLPIYTLAIALKVNVHGLGWLPRCPPHLFNTFDMLNGNTLISLATGHQPQLGPRVAGPVATC